MVFSAYVKAAFVWKKSSGEKMSSEQRIEQAFKNGVELPLCRCSRYVVFGDCHRGTGNMSDNFLRNQHLYFAALEHYYSEGFYYLELGDGEELWENRSTKQIRECHKNVYCKFECFQRRKKFCRIYGNHDMELKKELPESILLKNQNTLFSQLEKSKRFGNVKIAKFVKESSEAEEKQFCAMTFIVSDREIFVAFRGTDETLTGWKENFNLSYEETPSQKRAVSYLEDIVTHTKKEIIVGGHSKGGNLAMYAYVFSKKEVQEKIKKVYNNDGPGLRSKENTLQEIEKKITTFIPKSSIVGGLFENDSLIKIIESSSIGILEHDLYTWKINGSEIITTKDMDKKTKELCNYINEKLKEIPDEKKRSIIHFIYELLNSFGINDIEETINKLGKNNSLLKKYNISIFDMQIIWKILPIILEIMKKFS